MAEEPGNAFRCQCSRWPASRCEHTMTQEDLLCDACRHGCSLLTIADVESWHVQMTDFKYQVTS